METQGSANDLCTFISRKREKLCLFSTETGSRMEDLLASQPAVVWHVFVYYIDFRYLKMLTYLLNLKIIKGFGLF